MFNNSKLGGSTMNNETKNQVSNYDFEYIFNTSSCEGDFKTDVNINAFGYKASGTRKFSSMKMLIRFMLQMTECMNLKDAVLTVHGNSREHEMALEALEQAQNKVSEIETNALDSLNEKLKTPTAKQEVVEQIAPSAPSTQLLDFTDPTTSDDAPSAPKEELTPMLKQFNDMKEKHPDAVLLFRCGDFYESYKEDAKILSDVLGITLTKRNTPDGYYMAGFPHHALDTYLPKLIRAGKRVAICDQIEQKPVIKRGRKPKVEETKEIAI